MKARSHNSSFIRALQVCLVSVVGVAGCNKQSEPVQEPSPPAKLAVLEPVADSPDVAEIPEPQPETQPVPHLGLDSWPGREELHTFDLVWLGGDRAVTLRSAPDADSSAVAQVNWEDGDEIDWRGTRLMITGPRLYEATQTMTLTGFPHQEESEEEDDSADRAGLGEPEELPLDPGEQLALYGYAGEGSCYVAVRGHIYVSECPELNFVALEPDGEPSATAKVSNWTPQEQQWWVLVSQRGERGWLRVDEDDFDVKTRMLAGYD